MYKRTGLITLLLAALLPGQAQEAPAALAAPPAVPAKRTVVYVIPVKEEINTPTLYILRRGLKEAIDRQADVVLLDMDTPGGALDTTFEIMEALEKFPGETLTYVNKEAISAGAFISATTKEIWFAPGSVIGASAPVMSGGKDIDETMRLKIVSYLRARVRAVSEGKGYRGQAIEAMIDKDYELKIGDVVIKPKGELLSRTATEAMATYGEPPQALLGAGKAASITELLTGKYGAGNFTVQNFEVTWSEELAQYLNAISPILMGLGMLALFIEFKTPGFGIFGIAGIVLLGIVFLGNYVAGFSGHEPLLLFAIGLIMVVVELIFFPGVAVVAVSGLVLMLGSLVWAMADIWPGEPLTVAWSGDVFVQPLQNLGLGLALAVLMAAALVRFLPKGFLWDRMVVHAAGVNPNAMSDDRAVGLAGQEGMAVTALLPSGQVEIAGRRYEARVAVGSIAAGTRVKVQGYTDFGLIVVKL